MFLFDFFLSVLSLGISIRTTAVSSGEKSGFETEQIARMSNEWGVSTMYKSVDAVNDPSMLQWRNPVTATADRYYRGD